MGFVEYDLILHTRHGNRVCYGSLDNHPMAKSRVNLTTTVTEDQYVAFKDHCFEQKTNPTALLRSMVENVTGVTT